MGKHTVIVGAGPSGLSAALYLSSNGVRVTLVDRMSQVAYDRYHSICGAGISEKAFRKLRYIEPISVTNIIRFGELSFPGGVNVRLPLRGYVLDRPSFLRDLKERCMNNGCDFINGTVINVEGDGGGFLVGIRDQGPIECNHVIGCDGAHSVVRKELFGWSPMEMIPTVECIVEGVPEPVFHMDLGECYNGAYSWVFPSGENVSIGSMVGLTDTTGSISHGARMIPIGVSGPIESKGAYICGDAAAMPNPVCIGGLMVGLLSGQKCAESIISGKKGSYQRWWDRCILSSRRFMDFHKKICSWSDSDFADSSEPFRGSNNIYLSGIKAIALKPKYIREYIGCLQTFRHAW